jgi:two-component sensor histidine kinase
VGVYAIQPSIIPADEAERIAAVRRYDILDTPPDGAFDRITAIAARRFNVPIAIVSIVDTDRIWFKSHHGLDVGEIGRDAGLCASAILKSDPHILLNAETDPNALANPLVAGAFGLRFYAGVPLRTGDGFNLGTLCVIDRTPRPITEDQIADLQDLASVVMDQIELRLAARVAVERAQIMAREIDHRVMNSLQFIAGLLSMQSRRSDMSDPADELRSASQRVAAIARVHRNFYMSEADDKVACAPFVEGLCTDLSLILGKTINAHVGECLISTEKISLVGLIVNELVTNAAKHGQGIIDVHYELEGSEHKLRVCDEGPGVAEDFDFESANRGLGVKIVATLAAQLSGTVRVVPIDGGKGACIAVRFPA